MAHDLDHQRAVQATLDYDLRIKLDQHSAEIHEALRYERQADKESQQRLTIELEMMRQLQDKKLDRYQDAMARQDKLQEERIEGLRDVISQQAKVFQEAIASLSTSIRHHADHKADMPPERPEDPRFTRVDDYSNRHGCT